MFTCHPWEQDTCRSGFLRKSILLAAGTALIAA